MNTSTSDAEGLSIAHYVGDLSSLSFETEYRSIKDDVINGFYKKCLYNSILYRRAVGYFASTVFAVASPAIIEFARRGGVINIICSPHLDAADVENIALGYSKRKDALGQSLIHTFDQLLAHPETARPAHILATLISTNNMEIKLAERRDRKGIYHEKIGVFSDSLGNMVSFRGSTNETWRAWHADGNFESFDVFCSWRGGLEAERVRKHDAHIAQLWSETDPHVEVMPFPETVTAYFKRFAAKGLDDVLADSLPTPTERRLPLPHQTSALAGWEAQGRRGIFEHATGSGKTFTAILALRNQAQSGLPSLVVVPSRLLLEQWAEEIRYELPSAALLLAGAGYERWRAPGRLSAMTDPDPALGGRIVLATMQTASTDEFRKQVAACPDLLLVADEVHQIGSPQNAKIMEIDAGSRLGLSATPIRYGDHSGTVQIFAYFGSVVPPPITLMDAVNAGRLVPYEYYPHPVNLTATEAEEWRGITKSIRFEMACQKTGSDGVKPLTEKAKMLLIKRARVAKKASNKVRLAANVLTKHYKNGQSWLVYCEDGGQLADVLIALREAGLEPAEYHTNMTGDREATLAWFKTYGGILVSIRCLDEGVDIPAISHALILASSQNPRQFIQRRGRVLRRSKGKHLAVIHDAIVVPLDAENEADQLSLLRSELVRSVEFASHALNRDADAELRRIAISMGIDPDSLSGSAGIEEDE